MPRTTILFGGPSPEHDISVSTGLQAAHTLGDVYAIYWDKSGRFHLVEPTAEPGEFADGVPRKAKDLELVTSPGRGFVLKGKPLDVGVVVNCCHGGPGEDGTIQGALDLAQLRYTGPGQLASALNMDKLLFSAAMAQAGLAVLPRVLLSERIEPGFGGPFIVKPRSGGSSIGIEVCEDLSTARALLRNSLHLRDGAVVEPFLSECRDLQIGVRTFPALELSAIEAPARSGSGLYSYEQKYLAWGDSGIVKRELPASLDPTVEAEMRRMAAVVTEIAGLRSVARIDFLEKDGEVWVNEVNTIPGSLAAYLWIDPPVSRIELLRGIISEAESQPPRAFSVAGADGAALRNARNIASKLG